MERAFRNRLLAFRPPMRADFLRILRMPLSERARTIGEIYRSGMLPEFSELLMDLEADLYARTVVLGLLAELELDRPQA